VSAHSTGPEAHISLGFEVAVVFEQILKLRLIVNEGTKTCDLMRFRFQFFV